MHKHLPDSRDQSDGRKEVETAGELLVMSGIDPSRRAETLSVPEFVRLCNVLNQAIGSAENKTT